MIVSLIHTLLVKEGRITKTGGISGPDGGSSIQ